MFKRKKVTKEKTWKQKYDDYRIAKEKPRTEAFSSEPYMISEEERKKMLKTLAENFQCNVCGKPSSEPGYCWTNSGNSIQEESWMVEDWSCPGDMEECDKCKNYACIVDCLHTYKPTQDPPGWEPNKICKNCAEKEMQIK